MGDIVGYLMGAGNAGSLLVFQDKKVGLRKMEFISHFSEKCCYWLRFQRKLKVWIFCYHRSTFCSLLVGSFRYWWKWIFVDCLKLSRCDPMC